MKKILYKTIIIFLIFVLIYVSYLRFVKKDIIPMPLGYGCLIVLTGSMEPEIKSSSFIIIKKEKEYNLGDIITYIEDNNYIVTHRIVNKDKNVFVTKGDNNNFADKKINSSDILGKVIFSSFLFGIFIIKYLKYIFILFTIIILIVNLANNKKRKVKYEKET